MFLQVPELLNQQEVSRLRQIASEAKFLDGRMSNPGNATKDNLQVDISHPGYQESAQIMSNALQRNQAVADFALPKILAPPLLCRYDPNMKYGAHADTPYPLNFSSDGRPSHLAWAPVATIRLSAA